MKVRLGTNRDTGNAVYLPIRALDRHLHLVGVSGSGKTTALLTLLTQLVRMPFNEKCVIILDRLGGFSQDLLRWFASDFCPQWVRERLIYIEAADELRTVPLHPLSHGTPGEAYYRTARAMEIVLRGWHAQDLSQQPRLARWMFNAFYGATQLGLCISDCAHFLYEHSPFHLGLIDALPIDIQREWLQILTNKNQADIQLESTRNRLKPFFVSNVLKWMFSSATSHFDIVNWMRQKKIVIVNLAPKGKIANLDADTIGGLIVNEVLSIARSLEPQQRRDTLLVLDEFQRFVNADLEFALAESRQLKVQLVLSHQSFSQLEQNDVDLTSLIFQCGTRLMLNSKGKDATILAEELAGFTFDPDKVHDEIWHRCQRVSGHKIIDLQSSSQTEQLARQWAQNHSDVRSAHENRSGGIPTGQGTSDAHQRGHSDGESSSNARSTGTHESLMPIYEEYEQLASRNYFSFEDQKNEWGKKLRRLKTGEGVLQIVNDDELHEIAIDNWAVGALAIPWEVVCEELPLEKEAYDRLLEENYRQGCFVRPEEVERETIKRLETIVHPTLRITTPALPDHSSPNPMD